MDDSQTAFATQYSSYPFDIDMMKVRVFSLVWAVLTRISALSNPLAVLTPKKRVGLPHSRTRQMAMPSMALHAMHSPTMATAPVPTSPSPPSWALSQTVLVLQTVPSTPPPRFPSIHNPMVPLWAHNSAPTMPPRSPRNSNSSSKFKAALMAITHSIRTACSGWECPAWVCSVAFPTMARWAISDRCLSSPALLQLI